MTLSGTPVKPKPKPIPKPKPKPKPKKQAPPARPVPTLAGAGLESFVMREVHRSALTGADYNPRHITDEERNKLKAALKRHGLVAPVTFNVATGNIVGGHQRISIMDSLMKTGDYRLVVAQIDVPIAREKELNVLLNNQSAMGSFDLTALKTVFDDADVSLEGAGFDMSDMIGMFGDGAFDERPQDLKELAAKLSAMTDSYTAIQHANRRKAEGEFYLVFIFPDSAHVDALLDKYEMRQSRYQNGRHLMALLGVEEPVLPAQVGKKR